MKPHVRAAIAAAALSHATGKRISSIYSYSGEGYISMSVTVTGDRVTGYDYANSHHFSGSLKNLYHYGESSHINIKIKPNGKYGGYDYGSGSHFDITIKGNRAELYDYGVGSFFTYQV